MKKPKFEKTYCSQCGNEFGPGDHGYSHCKDHRKTDYAICTGCGLDFPAAELFSGKCNKCLLADEQRQRYEQFDRERIEQCQRGWAAA